MENAETTTGGRGKSLPVIEKKCHIEGCRRPYRAKGYCNVHYRLWRHGEMPHPRWKNVGKTSAAAAPPAESPVKGETAGPVPKTEEKPKEEKKEAAPKEEAKKEAAPKKEAKKEAKKKEENKG